MKIKDLIRFVIHSLARRLPSGLRRNIAPEPPPEQLDLGLDELTTTGLPLRDALPVRSAEYWLQLGEPDLALKELATLPESTRGQEWPLRVQLAALQAATGSPDFSLLTSTFQPSLKVERLFSRRARSVSLQRGRKR